MMRIWDRGRYETLHWNEHKVEVRLRGMRVRGRYVFVNRHTGDRDWLVQRLDSGPGVDTPEFIPPMLGRTGTLPPAEQDDAWAYEFRWTGQRIQTRVEGGRITLRNAEGEEVTAAYPELAGLGEQLGATEVLLDGELIALAAGKPSAEALAQPRTGCAGAGGQAPHRAFPRGVPTV